MSGNFTQYSRTGFFQQEIIWKSWKNQKFLERFESHFEYFLFNFNFLEFCDNFVPDFENLYYLLDLNISDSIKESSSESSRSKQDCSKN